MRPFLAGRLVGALAVVLVLTACGPDKDATATRTSSPSTSHAPTTTAPTTTAPATPTVPRVGSVLASLTNGYVIANAAGQGFSILVQNSSNGVESSTLMTYDLSGRQLTTIPGAGHFTGSCGVADVVSGGRRIIVGETLASTPAQGINPAQYSAALSAFDATTGKQVWKTQLVQPQSDEVSCSSSEGNLTSLQATTDGAWAAVFPATTGTVASAAVDLRTGQVYPKPDLQGAIGTQLVVGGTETDNGSGKLYVFALPPTWQGLGSFSTGRGPGLVWIDDPRDLGRGVFVQSGSGISDDGSVLFVAEPTVDSNSGDGTELTAYALPAMTQVWRQDTTGRNVEYSLVGQGGTTLVVRRIAAEGTTVDGLDARTGQPLWTLAPMDHICGISSSQMLVQANGQLATLDLATGKQLSFAAPPSSGGSVSCPEVLTGGRGIAVRDQAVIQALQP